MHREEFIADNMIKVGYAVISADWRSADRSYLSDFRLYTHAAQWFACQIVEIDHEIFSTVILSLPLSQEGELSVSGERMCTILVNSLEDYACLVNVWLGKLTALDMNPLGWLGRKTSTQTNKPYTQVHFSSQLPITHINVVCY